MAHNLSIIAGQAEMFSGNNVVPWHKLGTVVSGLLTAAAAMEAAHLGWTVKPMKLSCNGRELDFPDYQGIIREDTGDCLGVAKGRYECIQNRDCFDFMDVLAGEGKLKYETAGALRGGKQVWMMAKLDGDFTINGDPHQRWLLLVTSHDGSYSLMVQWVATRVVCNNTLSIALRDAKNQVKIRHTQNWSDKAEEARRILGLGGDYFEEMRKTLGTLGDVSMTKETAAEFTKLLFPAKDEKEIPTRTSNMRWGVQRLFNRPEAGTYGQTRWDMLNAVSDFADHYQTMRGENSTRLETALLTSGAQLKQKATEMLTSEDLMASLLNRPARITVPLVDDFQSLLSR